MDLKAEALALCFKLTLPLLLPLRKPRHRGRARKPGAVGGSWGWGRTPAPETPYGYLSDRHGPGPRWLNEETELETSEDIFHFNKLSQRLVTAQKFFSSPN